jgi:hypothetical protein
MGGAVKRARKWLMVSAALVILIAILMWFELWLWVIGGLILLAALAGWYFHSNQRSERSQGLAAALSILALLFGVYWYLIERPGTAKLDLVLAGQGFRTAGGKALLFLSVEVRNVGNTPVSFEGSAAQSASGEGLRDAGKAAEAAEDVPADIDCRPQPGDGGGIEAVQSVMSVRIGKVVPVHPDLRDYLGCATYPAANGSAAILARADLWPPLAWVDQDLVTKIEAGESEKYYYRMLVPCEPRLVVSATARIPKRATFTDTLVRKEPAGQVWIAQTLVDLSSICKR